MKKLLKKTVILLMILLVISGCNTKKEEPVEPDTSVITDELPFTYEHDPRDNPEAMKDIIENPDAVYGFSPNPASDRLGNLVDLDWTDKDFVAKAREERIAYHNSMESMIDILYHMREDGASTEEMARAVSAERNRIRLASYSEGSEELQRLKESNLETYGHEDGPTPEQLFEKYGSWAIVIQKAFSPNLGMDVICGLYDNYYQLYIELGLAEDDTVSH